LGYTASVTVAGYPTLNISTNYNMCNLTVGVGVWIFTYGFTISCNLSNIIQTYISQLSNNSTFSGNYANTLNQFTGTITTTTSSQTTSCTYSAILTLTSSTTVYLTFKHVSTQASLTGKDMFINATRIA
jgi:uncharacterized membrane protein